MRDINGSITAFEATLNGAVVCYDSTPVDISPTGNILGWHLGEGCWNGDHGFVRWTDGSFSTIDVPGATSTDPAAFNAAGQIVGSYTDTNSTIRGFLRRLDGTFVTFAAPGADWTSPGAINASGEIIGSWGIGADNRGFARMPDGTFTPIDAPGASTANYLGTHANAINSSGQITGVYYDAQRTSHGFLWSRNNSTTYISSSSSTLTDGQKIRFTAKVMGTFGAAPAGKVTFWNSSYSLYVLGTAPIVNGRAVLTVPMGAGPDRQYVMAVYDGDGNYNQSESPYIPDVLHALSRCGERGPGWAADLRG